MSMPAQDAQCVKYVSAGLVGAFNAAFVVLVPLVFYRRRFKPLSARSVMLITLMAISAVVNFNLIVGRYFQRQFFPCWLLSWLFFVALPSAVYPYFIHSWRVFYIYKFHLLRENIRGRNKKRHGLSFHDVMIPEHGAVHAIEMNNQDTEGTENFSDCGDITAAERDTIQKHKKYVADSFLLKVYLIALGVHIVVYGIVLACKNDFASHVDCTIDVLHTLQYVLSVELGLCFAGLVGFALLLVKVKEAFKISREMNLVAFTWLIFTIIYLVLRNNIKWNITVEYLYFPSGNFLAIALSINFLISFLGPLCATYGKSQKIHVADSEVEDMYTKLGNNEFFSAFREYCSSEFALENIEFWRDVTKYTQIMMKNERVKAAFYINNTYVKLGSFSCLSISDQIRDEVQNNLRAGDKNLFAGVLKEIEEQLLEQYLEWVKTFEFHQLQRSLSIKHTLFKEVTGV